MGCAVGVLRCFPDDSNGHLYIIHLLMSEGADPNIRDAQGFNTLHLVTHSSAVMPLLYMVSCTVKLC